MLDENMILNELYDLTLLEQQRELTEKECIRYLQLVDTCHENNFPIDFAYEV
ncbi:MAG: hypothetical protein WD512_18555 [Candidatus Paceibacterota bacterium]